MKLLHLITARVQKVAPGRSLRYLRYHKRNQEIVNHYLNVHKIYKAESIHKTIVDIQIKTNHNRPSHQLIKNLLT